VRVEGDRHGARLLARPDDGNALEQLLTFWLPSSVLSSIPLHLRATFHTRPGLGGWPTAFKMVPLIVKRRERALS